MSVVGRQATVTAERPLEKDAESLTRRMFRISEEQENSNQQGMHRSCSLACCIANQIFQHCVALGLMLLFISQAIE